MTVNLLIHMTHILIEPDSVNLKQNFTDFQSRHDKTCWETCEEIIDYLVIEEQRSHSSSIKEMK